ncbi:hypothetical protein EGR_04084 [Echinococcus granulosus]|uniref:Uncharacterized protein n=1 Tax=Echinococcus granulosus TaxID=6210 RepID=W6UIS2_ECHGR|nr:hypothetical protein EGR_04084 [Echinococcus granulosus]EUB61051.1 hypothetical protein EGR_04084 [Echinococcus granulosus]
MKRLDQRLRLPSFLNIVFSLYILSSLIKMSKVNQPGLSRNARDREAETEESRSTVTRRRMPAHNNPRRGGGGGGGGDISMSHPKPSSPKSNKPTRTGAHFRFHWQPITDRRLPPY